MAAASELASLPTLAHVEVEDRAHHHADQLIGGYALTHVAQIGPAYVTVHGGTGVYARLGQELAHSGIVHRLHRGYLLGQVE